jgi:pyrimidine operon attenuation protein/uracil phosphoribosyltransferase
MDSEGIARALRRMAQEIVQRAGSGLGDLAIVGIRRGGDHLATRLRAEIAQASKAQPPLGTLDIALYRDDIDQRGNAPVVGPTEIHFSVGGRTIVLVDDVLFTGRTVRAALDELVDFGRPRQVWLAVLIDRGGRELPIAPDFVGERIEATREDDVEVQLREGGAKEDVVLVKRGAGP